MPNPSPQHVPRPNLIIPSLTINRPIKVEQPPSRSGFPTKKEEPTLTAYERCLAENPGVETAGLCAAVTATATATTR
jgi:hypothetical protein